jgi:hypothetical protein
MTLTGHWNRIEKRTFELWPQNVLEQEKQKWQERWELYRLKVNAHMMNGDSVNRSRVWAFAFIVRQSLTSIQEKIDTIDILEGKTPEPSNIFM